MYSNLINFCFKGHTGAMNAFTKRVLHYFLLAVTLVGIPFVCCLVGGKDETLELVKTIAPVTENWGSMPEKLWNCRCPFTWGPFWLMVAFLVVTVTPFVRRLVVNVIKGGTKVNSSPSPCTFTFPWWGWLALVVMLVGWVLAWTRFEWFAAFQRYPYVIHWAGFIVLVNALCVKRCGRSPLTHHTGPFLLTFPASILFWWFFEYLNRYVWNWYYVGVPGISATEYVLFASLCFSSVLPGVTSVAALLGTFRCFSDDVYAGMAKVNVRSGASLAVMSVLSLIGLTGIVFCPQFTYPLLWISPLMVFILVQIALREQCVLDTLATGNWSLVFRFAIASLVCGLTWETWNYYSMAKWIYAVPYVHRFQVWEMPLVGFGGYLPFGMECAAVAAWISPKLIALLKEDRT